jgi:WD40 repeat protein
VGPWERPVLRHCRQWTLPSTEVRLFNKLLLAPRDSSLYRLIRSGSSSSCFFHAHYCSYPSLELIESIQAHPTNCIALGFTPDGTKFAIGSSDSNVTLWDSKELTCIRTISRYLLTKRTCSHGWLSSTFLSK